MYASDDSELMISVLLSSIALTQFTVAIIDKITRDFNQEEDDDDEYY